MSLLSRNECFLSTSSCTLGALVLAMLGLALIFGLITALANLLGSALAIFRKSGNAVATSNYIGFGGGFLLAAALFEILPESLEGGSTMPLYVIFGYVAVYLSEQVFASHAHEAPHSGLLPPPASVERAGEHTLVQEFRHPATVISLHAGLAALVGFTIHDFIDGLAIGSGMLTSENLGLLIFLAVLLHEVPAGFSISAIMLGAGRSRRASFLAGASIGFATLVGIMVPFLIGNVREEMAHIFLALSAGSFIYIAATDLIPASGGGQGRFSAPYVITGMGVFLTTAYVAGRLLG